MSFENRIKLKHFKNFFIKHVFHHVCHNCNIFTLVEFGLHKPHIHILLNMDLKNEASAEAFQAHNWNDILPWFSVSKYHKFYWFTFTSRYLVLHNKQNYAILSIWQFKGFMHLIKNIL